MEEVLDLGFGTCKLQVQVPEKGGILEAKDLVGKNVVTSFTGLTEQYFARLEGHEVPNGFVNGSGSPTKRKLKTKIKFVGGSVEAACALGVADGIVDLVGSFSIPSNNHSHSLPPSLSNLLFPPLILIPANFTAY